MGADQNIDLRMIAASALEWWREAGVDALVAETPRDWRAAEPPRADPRRPTPIRAPIAVEDLPPPPLPATLEAFEAWRAGPEAPEAGWTGRAIAGQGQVSADIMVLVDQPEREDADTGVLLSGAPGRLFDRMLAAIGLDRSSIYLAPLCAIRPVAGRIPPEHEARLAEVARQHIRLVAPKRLFLLGNAPTRALLGTEAVTGRGGLRLINLSGGKMPPEPQDVTTEAVASFHPRLLLERPAAKAEAWKDLQMLIGGLHK